MKNTKTSGWKNPDTFNFQFYLILYIILCKEQCHKGQLWKFENLTWAFRELHKRNKRLIRRADNPQNEMWIIGSVFIIYSVTQELLHGIENVFFWLSPAWAHLMVQWRGHCRGTQFLQWKPCMSKVSYVIFLVFLLTNHNVLAYNIL